MTATILIVDDSPTIRLILQFALESRGYNVVMAGDGEDGLVALEREQVDLVILDVFMPGLDGLGLLKIVRKRPQWANLPIMMLTTEGQEASSARAMALGANDYLTKPSSPEKVLEHVANLLDKSKVDGLGV
jgi:two-component system chemotaxis response regulator CheY